MRTTINIETDVFLATKEIARTENVGLGQVISRLVRQALIGQTGDQSESAHVTPNATGFIPFPARGVVITEELVDQLRDAEGV